VTGKSAAMFYFMAGTQPGKETEVLEEIGAEIARCRPGRLSVEELHRCQVRLKAGPAESAADQTRPRTMQAALDVLQGRAAQSLESGYDSLIDAVSLEDLGRVRPRRHLLAERRTQLVVRP